MDTSAGTSTDTPTERPAERPTDTYAKRPTERLAGAAGLSCRRFRGSFRGRVRGRVRGPVRGQVRGRCRLFYSILDVHTSRALTGSPVALPSRGPRGIPSLVVAITLDCRSTVIAGELASINVTIAVNCGNYVN